MKAQGTAKSASRRRRNKYPNVRKDIQKHFCLVLTDEQIEKYAQAHRILKKDIPEDIFDTMDRDLFIHAVVIDILGENYHWPLNGDPEDYSTQFYLRFFPKALEMGLGLTADIKRAVKNKKTGYRVVELGSAMNPYSVYHDGICLGSFPSKESAARFMRWQKIAR